MQVLLGAPSLDLEEILSGTLFRYRHRIGMTDLDLLLDQEVVALVGLKECRELLDSKVLARWQASSDNDDKGRVTPDVICVMGKRYVWPSLSYILLGHGSQNVFIKEKVGRRRGKNCRR